MYKILSPLLLVSVFSPPAMAHKPAFGPGFVDQDSAYDVDDNDVSIVVYQNLSCEEPELWLAFDAVAGEDLWVQLGVPVIERLEDHRPAVAVLAPGLPAAEGLPFAVPEGLGAVVLDARDADAAAEFYEEFSRTSSWVWAEDWVSTPESGPGYVVGFDPEGWTGKIWVATGTVEDFSDVDFSDFGSWDQQVNDFHETGKYGEPDDVVEEQCEPGEPGEEADMDGTEGTNEATSGACSTIGLASGSAWLWVAGLLGFRRRRLGLGTWLQVTGHDSGSPGS